MAEAREYFHRAQVQGEAPYRANDENERVVRQQYAILRNLPQQPATLYRKDRDKFFHQALRI